MSEELYKKYRPTKFSEVVGQEDAIRQLTEMGKNGFIPHAILFTGPSGCGKTTLARILRVKLKCSDHDFVEMNASDCRGIDEIRAIRSTINLSPLSPGGCRVILIDECHGLTSDAQEAFLKLLEDTPKHIYFFLATTLPAKLKKTIITRCTEIKCKEITATNLVTLVKFVCEQEGIPLKEQVIEKIARVADGSARKALVLLHQVIGIADEVQQLAAIEAGDSRGQAIDICRLLLNESAKWSEMAKLLETVEEDAEAIRRIILGYAQAVLLKSGKARASDIIEEFRLPFYDIGKPGLVNGCYRIMTR